MLSQSHTQVYYVFTSCPPSIDAEKRHQDSLSDVSSEDSSGRSTRSSTITGMELDTQEYVAIDMYEGMGPGQLSFEEGEVITVLDKMVDGEEWKREGEREREKVHTWPDIYIYIYFLM